MGTGVAPPVRPPGTLETEYISRETLEVKDEKVELLTFHFLRFPPRTAVRVKTTSIRSKDDDVKPHDRLVLVSYSPYGPSTPSLSNS
jgi:hypothetical protein